MKNNQAFWLAAISVLVAGLLFASCGPGAATPPPTTPPAPAAPSPTPPAPAPTPAPAPARSTFVEKPKYGGTLNVLQASSSVLEVWDSAAATRGMGAASYLVYQYLTSPDWSKGLAGTGEVDWGSGVDRFEGYGPELAESWQIPELGTWIFKIRRGVHYALDPSSEASRLVNGRELTADDVAWNIARYHTAPEFANNWVRIGRPDMAKAVIVEKTGPWEVTLKTPVDPWTGFFWIVFGGNSQHFFAPEVMKKYGNGLDWRNAVGTGAYIVTDLVSGSAATYKRNPNYWDKDPVGPGKGNQLPYVDTVKLLIIPDLSTRLAAMRTGRADWVTGVEWEDASSLTKTNPELVYKKYLPSATGIDMRPDKADLPFKDRRVRQALMLATDFEALKNDLYGGQAEVHVWPVAPTYEWLYVPMKELPDSVQALYKYNPEKSKQLLAEAGYPKGFKTKMIVQNISTEMDPAAALKAMWAKVGVDVEIQPRDTAVYTAIRRGTEEEMMMRGLGTSLTLLFEFAYLRGPLSNIDDPTIEAAYQQVQKNIIVNMSKAAELFRKLTPYVLEQAYYVPRPTPYSYTFWQPWVKNHYGETSLYFWLQHAWVDQDLKEKMMGRR